MTMEREIPKFAVVGEHVENSLSPCIHVLFGQQTRTSLQYDALSVPTNEWLSSLVKFTQAGGMGVNITAPFKEEAYHFAHTTTVEANLAEAVNTLAFTDDGSWHGTNTDGLGFINDLKRLNLDISDKKILILGAGGAVRGILGHIVRGQPKSIMIANRTLERAQILANKYNDVKITACQSDELYKTKKSKFDWVIHATSATDIHALTALPDQLIHKEAIFYDLNYGTKLTPFLTWCWQRGGQHLFDGLGMLVEQAALAFGFWHHIHPQTEPILDQLRPLCERP